MSDVMDRLRAADPEPDCPQPPIDLVWAKLDERDRRGERPGSSSRPTVRRGRDLLGPAVGIAVVAVIAMVALTVRPGGPPSRSVGASRGTLIEFDETDVFTPARSSGASFSSQRTVSRVWVAGSGGHSLATVTYIPPGGGFVHEIAVNGDVLENYQGGPATTSRVVRSSCVQVVCGIPSDPVATFRRLRAARKFRANGYVNVDHRRLASYLGGTFGGVRVFVDPRTDVPVRIVVTYGAHPGPQSPTDTIMISNYHRVPLTGSNSRLLLMGPRPQCHAAACLPGTRQSQAAVRPLGSGLLKPTSPALGTPSLRGGAVITQINMTPPVASRHAAAGVAQEIRTNAQNRLVLNAAGLQPTTSHDTYAIWVYSSARHNRLLGVITAAVGKDGRFHTAGYLPRDAGGYRQILVTRETRARPIQPGLIVLIGKDTLR